MRGFRGASHIGIVDASKPIADVFPGISAENYRILGYQRHASTYLLWIGFTDIDTIEAYNAGIRIVKA